MAFFCPKDNKMPFACEAPKTNANSPPPNQIMNLCNNLMAYAVIGCDKKWQNNYTG
jgi:hypothetical protein